MNINNPATDVYLKFYQEHVNQWRHYESQRAAVAGSILAIATALIGLVTFDKLITRSDLPLTLLIAVLGILGALFSAKQHERACLHMERARHYRSAIDATFENSPLSKIKTEADRVHSMKFRKLQEVKVNILWRWFYLLLSVIGISLTVFAMWAPAVAA